MSKSKKKPNATEDDTNVNNAAVVIEYLLSHPNFFAEHSNVLSEMNLAHDSGTASSLIERQVSVLRIQNHKTRSELHDATENARVNEQLSHKIHQLSLQLLTTNSFEQSLAKIVASLNTDFDIKWVKLRLLNDRVDNQPGDLPATVSLTNSDDDAIRSHLEKLERGEVVCGQLNDDQINRYFDADEAIASAALLPLSNDNGTQNKKVFGMIGLGCAREDRFRRDLGTVFLARLAELISDKLWLDLNAK